MRVVPVNKVYPSPQAAVADILAGATVFVDGFGGPGGMPHFLILALWERGVKGLTVVSNTAGIAMEAGFGMPGGKMYIDHSILIENDQVKKVIASFPVAANPSRPVAAERAFREGKLEIETVPQGTLVERIRAAGAGIPAFYTPTGAGTWVEHGKEKRVFNGRECLLEHALPADFALLRAWKADRLGNLVYRGTSRNFNAVMATAARVVIAEVDEILEAGELDPNIIHTPFIYVDRLVRRPKDDTPILAETYRARLRERRPRG
mgnify:CR=1 FL=1